MSYLSNINPRSVWKINIGIQLSMLIGIILYFIAPSFSVAIAIYFIIALFIQFIITSTGLKPTNTIDNIEYVLEAMKKGNYSERITLIKKSDRLYNIVWNLNDALDRLETYFHESSIIMDQAGRGKFYRRINFQGLTGALVKSLLRTQVSYNAMYVNHNNVLKEHVHQNLNKLKTQTLLVNLQHAQTDINQITNVMDEVATISEEAAHQSGDSKSATDEVSNNMYGLIDQIAEITQQSNELTEKTSEVADVLNFISNIAGQTNLLALNAAIEAARAGEHGRGFAVVADEVKNLSQNTLKATNDIKTIIDSFIVSANKLNENAESMNHVAQNSQNVVSNFSEVISTIGSTSLKVFERNSFAQIVSFASLIKLDHLVYLNNGYSALMEGVDSDVAKAARVGHQECRFGEWMHHGLGKKHLGHLPSYPLLDEPHKLIHDHMHNALDIMQQGNWDSNPGLQAAIINEFKHVEDYSLQVIHLIDTLIEEKMKFEVSGEINDGDDGEIAFF